MLCNICYIITYICSNHVWTLWPSPKPVSLAHKSHDLMKQNTGCPFKSCFSGAFNPEINNKMTLKASYDQRPVVWNFFVWLALSREWGNQPFHWYIGDETSLIPYESGQLVLWSFWVESKENLEEFSNSNEIMHYASGSEYFTLVFGSYHRRQFLFRELRRAPDGSHFLTKGSCSCS